jgi:hypothetical protein
MLPRGTQPDEFLLVSSLHRRLLGKISLNSIVNMAHVTDLGFQPDTDSFMPYHCNRIPERRIPIEARKKAAPERGIRPGAALGGGFRR